MKDMNELFSPDEKMDNVVVMTDEDGNDVEMEWLDTLHYDDRIFVVLLPTCEEDRDSGVIILELDPYEEDFSPIEDDDELNRLFEIFKERNKDQFDFGDQ